MVGMRLSTQELHDIWHDARQALDAMKDSIARADAAAPGLAKELPSPDALTAAQVFFDASERS
jgi:hypothetical protein